MAEHFRNLHTKSTPVRLSDRAKAVFKKLRFLLFIAAVAREAFGARTTTYYPSGVR